MGSTEGSTNNGAPAIRIDGWKDIAAHLGRSVRTVQRWERELGLPIRRLDTGTAEVVNALRDELDAWVVRHSRVSQAEPADERTPAEDATPRELPSESSDEPPQPARTQTARATRRWWALAGAAALVAVAALGWWAVFPGLFDRWSAASRQRDATWHTATQGPAAAAREPQTATLQGRTLTAKSADGTVLWTRQFDTTFMDFFETAAGSLTVSRMRIPIRCASATWHTTLSE